MARRSSSPTATRPTSRWSSPSPTGEGRHAAASPVSWWTARWAGGRANPHMGEWGPAALSSRTCACPRRTSWARWATASTLGMQWIGQGALGHPGARASGRAERMLGDVHRPREERVTFGKPIAERQAIQWMIADSAVEIEATKWLTFHAAWLAEQGRTPATPPSMAKLYGANMANRVVDRVMQIHGGMGYTTRTAHRALVPRDARLRASSRAPMRSSGSSSRAICCAATSRSGSRWRECSKHGES